MRSSLRFILLVLLCWAAQCANGQGLHYSQFYNAPLLLSPANTALMPESDFRAGVNYRNQWANVPATFRTISAYGDFQLFRNVARTNWLGIGAAISNDRAGNGDLSLLNAQLTAAYHLQLGEYNMLSVGLGAAFVQRGVNFSKLTFDSQWDGFRFDPRASNGESYAFQKTTYADITAGINYAYFPNENVYIKLGAGLLHVNRPTESFYSMDNKLGMRPTGNLDMLFRLGDSWIADISAYYTYQRSASELVFGSQFSCNVAPGERNPSVFIFGAYYRMNDAIIPLLGFEWSNIRLSASVDVTASGMTPATGGNGAFEISLIYKGLYGSGSAGRSAYNCPRF